MNQDLVTFEYFFVFAQKKTQNAAYLLIRGIKTMHLRLKQQNSTALRMAQVLEAHPKVLYFPPKKPFFLYIYIFLVCDI